MPIVSGGGGGGSAFATPVTITPTDAASSALTITQAANPLQPAFVVNSSTGAFRAGIYTDDAIGIAGESFFELHNTVTSGDINFDTDGTSFISPAGGSRALQIAAAAGSTEILRMLGTGGATLARVLMDGAYITAQHAAPADGDLSNGDMAIWFDQTSGAAKLMVKAKQADGTVRTGSLALV